MTDFYLNYASYCDGTLYCMCCGRFTDEEQALAERDRLIAEERDANKECGVDFDKFIVNDSDDLFEWDDGFIKKQYSIQEIF